MTRVLLLWHRADHERGARLAACLNEAGIRTAADLGPPTDLDPRTVDECSAVVLLQGARRPSARARRLLEHARRRAKPIVVLTIAGPDTAPVSEPPSPARFIDFTGWDGTTRSPVFRDLLQAIDQGGSDERGKMAGAPADDGDATRVFRGAADEEIDELRRAPIPSATTVLKSVLAAGARGAARRAREVRDRLRPTQVLRMPLPEEPPPPTASAPITEPTSDEVRLAVAAPRRADQGTTFVARFAAYVEGSRVETLEKLAELGETGDRIVKDVAPSRHARWAIGAPVTVRLTSTSESLAISPATASFEWNGRDSLLSFLVTVKPAAPCSTAQLCFAVVLDTVPIAFLPLGVAIAQGAAEPAPATETVEVAAPKSAFASYASKDASNVAGRLSSLSRWAPGLDIFQDCLDLRANEQFKPQLEREIVHRDVFLLFWSRNARASRWVKWEYETARDGRGLAVILPMPLEDPAIAPPPDEFAQDHWRDRFLLAGYALAKIADDAGTPPTTAP